MFKTDLLVRVMPISKQGCAYTGMPSDTHFFDPATHNP